MIRFCSKAKVFFGISIGIFIIGIAAFIMNGGVILDIEFKGGAIISYVYDSHDGADVDIDESQARKTATDFFGRETCTVQITSNLTQNIKKVVFNLPGEGVSPEECELFQDKLHEEFPEINFSQPERKSVRPSTGLQFLLKSLMAIAVGFISIIIYVAIRFKKISGASAGMMALVALFHDVIVVFIVYVLFRIPLNGISIAVFLSVIGYSINNTIIIYDRIRENKAIMSKTTTLEELVDTSVTQTLARTIITSGTTLAVIAIAFMFAMVNDIESIMNFVLPMMFGIVSETYSSICLVGPLWVKWQNRKARKMGIIR